jgi:hypothetical protein
MIRFLVIILISGLLMPHPGRAASSGDDAVEQHPAQQTPMPDASINRQILQTVTDIRDTQLAVLQAQVEILTILRAQGKTIVAVPSHEAAPAAGHRTVAKGHKPKSNAILSAAE